LLRCQWNQKGRSAPGAGQLTPFRRDCQRSHAAAGAETGATHDGAQNKLATLSTDSSHRVVEGASHAGLIFDERYSHATTRAILDVVSSVRNNQPLED